MSLSRFTSVMSVACLMAFITPVFAQVAPQKPKPKPARIAVTDCRTVSAVAAFFGEEKTRAYAEGNLDTALDMAKSRLTADGRVGLVVKDRKVTCKNYINFGSLIGQEQKCLAQAQLCVRAR